MSDTNYFSQGGCTCGAVRYELALAPMFVHCCHCTWCQKETGSAFVLNALVETSALTVTTGTPERIRLPSESGKGQTVFRCATCNCDLWSHFAMAVGKKVAFVRVSTLDDPNLAPPDIHIFTRSKQHWIDLDSVSVPVMETYYRRSEQWPADAVARFNALRE